MSLNLELQFDDRNFGEVEVAREIDDAPLGTINPWELAMNNLENSFEDQSPRFNEFKARLQLLIDDMQLEANANSQGIFGLSSQRATVTKVDLQILIDQGPFENELDELKPEAQEAIKRVWAAALPA